MLRLISHSERQTLNLGTRIVRFLGRGDVVCLMGALGSGKTILVKGMAKGLGINKDKVISPSFVLIREYLSTGKTKLRIPLYHLDLYRLKNPKELLNLGYEEYLYGQGICVVEWAERMMGFLPSEFLKIELNIKDKTQRVIKLIAKGKRYIRVLGLLETKI